MNILKKINLKLKMRRLRNQSDSDYNILIRASFLSDFLIEDGLFRQQMKWCCVNQITNRIELLKNQGDFNGLMDLAEVLDFFNDYLKAFFRLNIPVSGATYSFAYQQYTQPHSLRKLYREIGRFIEADNFKEVVLKRFEWLIQLDSND